MEKSTLLDLLFLQVRKWGGYITPYRFTISFFCLIALFFSSSTFAGNGPSGVNKNYQHWADGDATTKFSAQWQGDILSDNKSDYFEGEVIPHVYAIPASNQKPLVNGQSYSFNIIYNYYQQTNNAGGFAYITTYNISRQPGLLPGATGLTPTEDHTFTNGGGMNGNFYTVYANITNVSNVSTSTGSNKDQTVTVTFEYTGPTTTNGYVEIYYGLFIATPGLVPDQGSGPTNGAHAWSGGSLQTTVSSDFTGALSIQLSPSAIIPGTISGLKYKDLNKNGVRDGSPLEPVLSGWTIYLDNNNNGILDAGEVSTTTNPDGTYSFSVTPDADKTTGINDPYYIREVLQSGWEQTQPSAGYYGPITITSLSPNSSGNVFGNFICINPTITLTGIAAICAGTTSTTLSYSGVTGSPDQYKIVWSSGLTSMSSFASLPASPISITGTGSLAAGTYNGTIYVKNSTTGCTSGGDPISLTVNANPTITLTGIAAICAGTTSTTLSYSGVTGSPDQYKIVWSSGLTSMSSFASLPASPISITGTGSLAAGTYNGTIYVKNSTTGCTSGGDPISLTVNANPTITLTGIAAICAGTTSTTLSYSGVTGSPDQYKIVWSSGLTSMSSFASLPASPISITGTGSLAAGTYNGTIYVKNSTTGCTSGGDPISLTVNANPTITLTGIAAICAGTTSTTLSYSGVTGSPDQYKIVWSSGLTSMSSFASLPASPISITGTGSLAAGTYNGTIYVKNSTTGCTSGGDPISLTVNANPTITLTGIAAICAGTTSTTLSYSGVTGSPDQYKIVWSSGLTSMSSFASLPASPISITGTGSLAAGTYNGTIYVKNSTTGCTSGGDPISLTVNANPDAPTVSTVNPTCSTSHGSITVLTPTGTGYEYNYNNQGYTNSTGPFSFAAGAGYSLVVKDANGCVSTATSCDAEVSQNVSKPGTSVQEQQSEVQAKPGNQRPNIQTQVIQLLGQQSKVIAAPNPFNDRIKFYLESAVSGQGTLELFNLMGQKVKTVYQGYIEKGKMQTIDYNVPGAQRANLIYVFRVGDQKVTGKLIGPK